MADDNSAEQATTEAVEKISFTVAFKKQTYNVEFGLDQTLGELRQEIAK